MRVRRGVRPRRNEQGVAGVEAVLALTMLTPLLTGLLVYGNYFWQAQRVDVYAPHISQSSIVGQFTCDELIHRVEATALGLLNSTAGELKAPLATDQVVARVVEITPNQGVTVSISVRVPVTTPFTSILPNDGNLVSEVTKRLENVSLTTGSC